MPPMKPPQNHFGPQDPIRLSDWLHGISEAGAAQDRAGRKPQTSRRVKSLVEMVEQLKKRPK
jgi:hypothetical protein